MRWLVWFLAVLVYAYELIIRISPSVMVNELMETFQVNAAQLGSLSAFFFYIYAPMQIPVGLLMDRFGARRLLTLSTLISAVGTLLFGFSPTLLTAQMGRLLMGFGASFAFVGMVFVCTHWFSLSRIALLIGVGNSISYLAAACQGPLALAVNAWGWRAISYAMAFAGFALAFFMWLFLKEDPSQAPTHAKLSEGIRHTLHNFKRILSNPYTWIIGLASLLFYASTDTFAALWAVPFLEKAHGMSKPVAAFASSMIYLGWMFGGPLSGFAADRIGKRKPILTASAFLLFLTLIPIVFATALSPFFVYMLLFLVGFFSGAQLLTFTAAVVINPANAKGSSAALVNFIVASGSAILQPLIGVLIDLHSKGRGIGLENYTVQDFQWAISLFPIGVFLSILLFLFFKEKIHPTFREKA